MKHLLTIILIAFSQSTSFSQVGKQPTDQKELGEMVFKSLQDENYETFLNCIFTEADCDTLAKKADANDSLKTDVNKRMKHLTNSMRNKSKANFETIIATGKQEGVDWKKARLKDVKFDFSDRSNIQSSDIFLLCEYKDKRFLIKLNDCLRSNAWLMIHSATIRFADSKN